MSIGNKTKFQITAVELKKSAVNRLFKNCFPLEHKTVERSFEILGCYTKILSEIASSQAENIKWVGQEGI